MVWNTRCTCIFILSQPKMANVQSLIDNRARDIAKLESKINKVEDEVWVQFMQHFVYMHLLCFLFCRCLKNFAILLVYRTSGMVFCDCLFHGQLCFGRQYEEKQLRNQQERARKKLEFSNQISRLQNQLEYEHKRNTRGYYSYCTCAWMSYI